MTIKLAHIVNPVVVAENSDLYQAQPITFETMRMAKEFAGEEAAVELYSAQFAEDRSMVPSWITSTPDLERSILDFGGFEGKRKLPLIGDILARLYQATTAEYFIYTNVDIALMPAFYLAVKQLIEKGHDAFVINRRTIPASYSSVSEIPLMYGEVGQQHPGHDCFVFRRDAFPFYELGKTCIGAQWVGRVIVCNLACHAKEFEEFCEYHLTFHLGDDLSWRQTTHSPYNQFNEEEVFLCLDKMETDFGPFSDQDAVNRYIQQARRYLSTGESLDMADATSIESSHILGRVARRSRRFAKELISRQK